MTSSKIADKFSVVKLGFDEFIYFSSWWPEYFKKTCLSDASHGTDIPKNQKKNFTISKYRTMNFSSQNPSSLNAI